MRFRIALAALTLGACASSLLGASAHQTTGTIPKDVPPGAKCGANVIGYPDGNGPQGMIYVDERYADPDYDVSVWVYQESNNHPGMQTKAAAESILLGEQDIENCTTGGGHKDANGRSISPAPDTLIL